jgi:hypothetical protein
MVQLTEGAGMCCTIIRLQNADSCSPVQPIRLRLIVLLWCCCMQAVQQGQMAPGGEPPAAPHQVVLPSTLLVEALNEHVSTFIARLLPPEPIRTRHAVRSASKAVAARRGFFICTYAAHCTAARDGGLRSCGVPVAMLLCSPADTCTCYAVLVVPLRNNS